jgi:hypothetical protein
MKKESEMTMETLKKQSEMARTKQTEEIEKIKKGIKRHHKKPCPSFVKCLVLGMVEFSLVAGCLPLVLVALTFEPCCWFALFCDLYKYFAVFKLWNL